MKSAAIFCIVTFLIVFHGVLCFIKPCESNEYTYFDELTKTVIDIINDTCVPMTSKVNIISSKTTPSEVMDKISKDIGTSGIISVILEEAILNFDFMDLRSCNIFFIDSLEQFMKIFVKISPNIFDFHGYYLTVLTDGRINGTAIFELFWTKHIYNAAIIYVNRMEKLRAMTFSPFSSESCHDVKLIWVHDLQNLFNESLKNLNQCPINVQAPNWRPYSYTIDGVSRGRDVDLVELLSEALNFKLNLEILPDIASWGMLFENGTATGAIKNLFESKTDFIVGDYYLRPIRLKYMDASVEYFSNDVVFIIPPGRTLLSIEKLFQPFSRTVWIILTTLLIIIFTFLVLLGWIKRNIDGALHICFDMLSILFAVSILRFPSTSAIRWLFISFAIFCLVKQAVYQGLLFKFLQTDSKIKEVQSIDDMIERDFTFYSYDSMLEVVQSEQNIIDR